MLDILWLGTLLAAAPNTGPVADRAGVLAVEPDDDEIVPKGFEDGVEIKVTLDPSRVADLEKVLTLAADRGSRREIWFYDTASLRLFDAGLVLRARVKSADKADTTVKARPLDRARVPASWFALDGFKCEEDRVGERRVPSCSLTVDQPGEGIRAAASGSSRIQQLFSKDQARFFTEAGGDRIGWEPLVPLGPVPSLAWKVRTRAFDPPLSVEIWTPDGAGAILELSVRAHAEEADGVARRLDEYLASLGFAPLPLQEAKTRLTLARLAERPRVPVQH